MNNILLDQILGMLHTSYKNNKFKYQLQYGMMNLNCKKFNIKHSTISEYSINKFDITTTNFPMQIYVNKFNF